MFLIRILGLYILPNIYICLRLRSLITGKIYRNLMTAGYLLLILSFPLAEILSHSVIPGWINMLLLPGYLSVPFILYLFFVVFTFDVFWLINRLVKIIPPVNLKTRRSRFVILGLMFVLPLLIVLAGRMKFSTLRVNEYSIQIPRRSSSLQRIKIALASDFHLNDRTDTHVMINFTDRVNSLDADILLIPGDVLEGDRNEEPLEGFEKEFRRIRTTYGIYASLGNHEHYRRGGKLDFFERSNIRVLADTTLVIDHAFSLVGRNDNYFRHRKTIAELLGSTPRDLPVIVLDHRPTDTEAISATDADLAVSGHTHHGQLFPFNYITEKIYPVSWGHKKIRNTHVFVTSGVQLWGPPVRTAGDSEIMFITVDLIDL